jgi:lysozyme
MVGDEMTDIFSLLEFEEGFSEKPYYCSEGYPTVGFGIRIGPKGAALSNYTFTLPRTAAEVWTRCYMDEMVARLVRYPHLNAALMALESKSTGALYSDPRCCVLLSMCYQMGEKGVADFVNTLKFMHDGNYVKAAVNMLASKWARQTPNRAGRHAKQMQTGQWAAEYK